MKRAFALLMMLALLCIACGGKTQTNTSASSNQTAITAESGASVPVSAQETAAPVNAESLTDPTDASKETTDDFTILSDADAVTQNGSVYTIAAAGESERRKKKVELFVQ